MANGSDLPEKLWMQTFVPLQGETQNQPRGEESAIGAGRQQNVDQVFSALWNGREAPWLEG